jgi:dUTP pyrophosphatase
MQINVDVKILKANPNPEMTLPSYGTPGSAGLDLRAAIDEPILIQPNEAILIPTGLAIYIKDPNYAAMMMPRSGMGHKNGIILGNTIGLMDSDYQGEWKISVWNRSEKAFKIEPFERIAQVIFVPIAHAKFNIVEEFPATERGEGGFGSTGTKG